MQPIMGKKLKLQERMENERDPGTTFQELTLKVDAVIWGKISFHAELQELEVIGCV